MLSQARVPPGQTPSRQTHHTPPPPATPAALLAASMAVKPISSTHLQAVICGARNWDLAADERSTD